MKAEIISIGTELLLGEITDTNASYLASKLPELGIDLLWVTQVGDNLGRLKECLERAWNRSDLVLTTGGLGPTEDDLTREAIAEMTGEKLSVDPDLERGLREFFSFRSFKMPECNIKQATLIPSAQAIPNPRGTAPGWWVEREGRLLIAMPGPPSEMQRMWEKEISGRLRVRLGHEIILSRTIKTFGFAESAVDEMVSPFLSSTNPTLAVYAKPDGIHLRLTAKAQSKEEAEEMIAQMESDIRSLLGESIWGCDDETLEGVVGSLLSEKGLTLATMESCTGGLLANTITDVPGSSSYFKGGLVAYTNGAKISYGVDAALLAQHGAISPEVAGDMAEAARHRLGADIGVSITGVAGPTQVEGKPVGTAHIAIDDGREKRLIFGIYPPLRQEVKRRATYHALFELRKVLLSYSNTPSETVKF
ncbi:MAG: competence/damage-inducible protein A [Dehalococcoidia bacterium]|nr:competence/damage-inducible protein A [Dehalococcoidia bacterium]